MKCITILENITTHGRNARVNGVNAYLKQGTSLLYVRWMGAPGAVSYSIEFVPIGTSVEVQLQGSGGVYFVDAVTVTEAAEEASEYQSAIAQVVQTNDYSPFGAPLAGRTYKPIDENGKIELVKVTFDSGTDGWVSNGATLGNSQGRLQLLTYNAAAQSAQKTYTNLLTIGKKYRVSFDFVIDGITTASFTLSNGSTQVRNKLTTITTKEITEFTATATNLTLLATLSAGNYGRLAHIDNLVIEEIFEVGEGYRYAFNGKEDDNETQTQDYGMRIYNPRLGRFLSVDPLTKDYPMLTTYQFASNSPIAGVDMDGLEFFFAADGTFLGKVGNSTIVRVVNDGVTSSDAQKQIEAANRSNISSENFEKTANTFSSVLTFNGDAVTMFEFEQYGAIVYNETYRGDDKDEDSKQGVSDAIFNNKTNLTKDYPGIKKVTLQKALDKVMYGKDSHEQRMSDKRANPDKKDKIPGTKISLSKIKTKNYQRFFKTGDSERNKNSEMRLTFKTVINSLKRDNGRRKEDKAGGKSHWRGDGEKNTFR